MKTTSKPHWQTLRAASNFWNLFRFNTQVKSLLPHQHTHAEGSFFLLVSWVRGRRQAHNPTLTKIMRLTYNRSCSHNRPQTAACNAVYSISRRALLITRLGEQLPRPRQVSMLGKRSRRDYTSQVEKLVSGFLHHKSVFSPFC